MTQNETETTAHTNSMETFQATIEAERLQTTLALAHTLFDECHLYVDPEGVRVTAIDAATVVWADITLEPSAFETFEATSDHIGVDLERFRDVVGIANRGQSVQLSLDSATRTLQIRFDELEYTLALLDPETIRSPPAESREAFTPSGTVVADSATFDRSVRAAAMVSNHLEFDLDEDDGQFSVIAAGDTDNVSLTLSADDLVDIEPGDAHSIFSIDYLSAINRAMPSGVDIDLQFGTEQPLSVGYEFADGTGAVEYLVAPRITAN
ncbi:DNA polymerase sliding clamp [Natrialbaceae archaeon A-CW2]|uniref:DNA polymerase sliding clamp n=1 Tax=Natronosalvus amylolyticus TaxID=2961994 RepID=UPI0020C9B4D2|nr:DNA polymerase sliding clamp [Natronosalvus amylolyticus]